MTELNPWKVVKVTYRAGEHKANGDRCALALPARTALVEEPCSVRGPCVALVLEQLGVHRGEEVAPWLGTAQPPRERVGRKAFFGPVVERAPGVLPHRCAAELAHLTPEDGPHSLE